MHNITLKVDLTRENCDDIIAAIDCCISKKAAVNIGDIKNGIGLFINIYKVINIYEIMKECPRKFYNSGFIENVIVKLVSNIKKKKYTIPQKEKGFDFYCEKLSECINEKYMLIKNDDCEKGKAVCLKYGHEIGNYLEANSNNLISHGLVVAIGILVSAEVSYNLKIMSKDCLLYHYSIIENLDIKSYLDETLTYNIKLDNTFAQGVLDMILLEDLGKVYNNKGNIYVSVKMNKVLLAFKNVKKRIQGVTKCETI